MGGSRSKSRSTIFVASIEHKLIKWHRRGLIYNYYRHMQNLVGGRVQAEWMNDYVAWVTKVFIN